MMSLRRVGAGLILIVLCLLATLALPVRTWRTGRLSVPDLTFMRPEMLPVPLQRVWVDTDAACGHGPQTDVDDCLAVWLLARTPSVEIVGVSTVFGNAPLDVTDRTTRDLVSLLQGVETRSFPVYKGANEPFVAGADRPTAARGALRRALERAPLTIVALGPLTNLADALDAHPDLRAHVNRIVAVMGRRMGHLFHPAEGSGGGMLFGHGPVFRDFNFSADSDAVAALIAMHLPITLIPYDAARSIEITPTELNHLAARDPGGEWIAERSRGWSSYWRSDVGRSGFYPFDLLAAAYVRAPLQFRCASVTAWVGEDPLLFVPFLRPNAFIVGQKPDLDEDVVSTTALYCPATEASLETDVRNWLFTAQSGLPGTPSRPQ